MCGQGQAAMFRAAATEKAPVPVLGEGALPSHPAPWPLLWASPFTLSARNRDLRVGYK